MADGIEVLAEANDATPASDRPADTGVALPMVVALAVMVVWGGTPIFTKIAAAEIDPLQVGVLRTVIAGVLAFPLLLVGRQGLPSGRKREDGFSCSPPSPHS